MELIATFSPPGEAERLFRTVAGLGHDYGHYDKVHSSKHSYAVLHSWNFLAELSSHSQDHACHEHDVHTAIAACLYDLPRL